MTVPAHRKRLRRLQLSLAAAWATAWCLGVGSILWAAVRLSAQYHQRDLDADLALYAMAVYGLAWIDGTGHFHDEFFERETLLRESPFDIWVIAPSDPPVIHWQPTAPRFDVPPLPPLARQIVATETKATHDGTDRGGKPYRLHAIPSYDEAGVACIAIIVVGDVGPSRQAHAAFARTLLTTGLSVALAGIVVGSWLAGRSLRPVEEAFQQRERFLAGAAHELRTPVATLRAICESAAAHDEPPAAALARLTPVVLHAGATVEDLLLYARLGSGDAALTRERVRLDLLVESCLPEDAGVQCHTTPCTVVGDVRLLRVAVTNLLSNANRHGRRLRPDTPVHVSVRNGAVVVEDEGPGFAAGLLAVASEPFVSSPESRGVGLGLALTRLIAEVHDGDLTLTNRDRGGAKVTFRLPVSAVS